MRRIAVVAAAAAAAALGPPPALAQEPVQPPPALVLVVGDSLAAGLRPYLPGLLPGRSVAFSARTGWTTPRGMKALRVALTAAAPQTVVVSLGTNDGPDPARFADRVRRTLRAIPPEACVVWPALYRPRRKGAYREMNRALRREAAFDRRLVVVPWDRTVRSHAVRLRDGLHPDAAGYRWRSWLIAAAVARGC